VGSKGHGDRNTVVQVNYCVAAFVLRLTVRNILTGIALERVTQRVRVVEQKNSTPHWVALP
jgi:hypothetical protein